MSKENENRFLSSLSKILEDQNNVSYTENGAKGYKITHSAITDMFFKLSSYRQMTESQIVHDFGTAALQDIESAILFAFYVGDIREGVGERRTFLRMLDMLALMYPEKYMKILKFIPEYSRYDYLWRVKSAFDNPRPEVREEIINIIRNQLCDDMDNWALNKPISLLAKWLPSENATSEETKKYAKIIRKCLKMSSKDYRKMLSRLRDRIKLVETNLCEKDYDSIDYSTIPSKANLKYKKAFYRNDYAKYSQHILDVLNNKSKMNAKVLAPHEIVAKYCSSKRCPKYTDDALEAMWKSLDRTKMTYKSVLPIIDGSGSMYYNIIANSNICSADVAKALGIYVSEMNKGAFANTVMAFGRDNYFVSFDENDSLYDKLGKIARISDCGNTDIGKVYKNILKACISNRLSQEEMPEALLIISDMEFDGRYEFCNNADKSDMEIYRDMYKRAGYELPKLIFWNVYSRTCTIPTLDNERGLILMSGFSTNMMDMIITNKLDPTEAIMEKLYSERYRPILEAIK